MSLSKPQREELLKRVQEIPINRLEESNPTWELAQIGPIPQRPAVVSFDHFFFLFFFLQNEGRVLYVAWLVSLKRCPLNRGLVKTLGEPAEGGFGC